MNCGKQSDSSNLREISFILAWDIQDNVRRVARSNTNIPEPSFLRTRKSSPKINICPRVDPSGERKEATFASPSAHKWRRIFVSKVTHFFASMILDDFRARGDIYVCPSHRQTIYLVTGISPFDAKISIDLKHHEWHEPAKTKVILAASHISQLLPTEVVMFTVGVASAPLGVWTNIAKGTWSVT